MSTRDTICTEALRLFVREGLNGTTTRAIAAACAIAEGTIYRHFVSKEALAQELFTRNYLAFATYMERAAQRGTSARERFGFMLNWLLTAAQHRPELFDYLFITAPGLASQVEASVQTPATLLRRELADLVPPAELDLRYDMLMGALIGGVSKGRRDAATLANIEGLLMRLVENQPQAQKAYTNIFMQA